MSLSMCAYVFMNVYAQLPPGLEPPPPFSEGTPSFWVPPLFDPNLKN